MQDIIVQKATERARLLEHIREHDFTSLVHDREPVDFQMISESSDWPLVPELLNLCFVASQQDNDNALDFFDRLLELIEKKIEAKKNPTPTGLRELFHSPEMRRLAGVTE